MNTFYLPKIETRSTQVDGKPVYIVKGYATTVGNAYPYKKYENKSFKEFFSQKAIDNLGKKLKSQKVFVDAEHITAAKENTKHLIESIRKKAGNNFNEELDYINNMFKYSDIPMFKVEDFSIDDNGLFLDIRGNPFYREVDESHKAYFDAIWNSLENGFINGMSVNFKPTSTVKVSDGLTQIDDLDIFGISLTGGPSNEMAGITEVAMRSMQNFGGVKRCQKTTTLML